MSETATALKKQPVPRKRSKTEIGKQASSRKERTIPTEEERVLVPRVNDPQTLKFKSLVKSHGLKVQKIGCMNSNIQRGDEEKGRICNAMVLAVEEINLLKRRTQLAVKLWLTELLGSDEDSYHMLQELLMSEIPEQGGTLFWIGALNLLKLGKSGSKLKSLKSLEKFVKDNNLREALISKQAYTDPLNSVAKDLDKDLSSVIVGSLPELVAKVINYNPALNERIREIQARSVQPPRFNQRFVFIMFFYSYRRSYSDIEVFFRVNQLLPNTHQFLVFPLSDPTHSWTQFTETALDSLLFKKIRLEERKEWNKQETLAAKREKRKKEASKPVEDNVLLEKKGSLLVELFGKKLLSSRSYITIQEHMDGVPGDIILYNSITTNGLQLSVYFIDLTATATSSLKAGQKKLWKTAQFQEVKKLPEKEIPELTLCVDLGKTFTVGANAKGFANNEIRNLAIKKRAINEPLHLYQNWLEHWKSEDPHIAATEAESPSRREGESVPAYWIRYFRRYKILSDFYNSKKVMKKTWDMKKAREGEFGRAAHALLKMVNGSIGKKVTGQRTPVIGLGTSKFSSVNSLHTSFESFFVRKVKSLGYRVVGINEDYTSQKCPRCQTQTDHTSMRIKYCTHCDVHFHRDVMAAENMVNAVVEMMKSGTRPVYLQRKATVTTEVIDDEEGHVIDGMVDIDGMERKPKRKRKREGEQ